MKWGNWEWGHTTSVLVIVTGTLVLWLLLGRSASRARQRFHGLVARAQAALHDPDAQADVESAQRRLTAVRLLANGARYALLIGALLLILQQSGSNLGAVLLPAGFLGAAIGLGSQNMVRDLVAGFFIVFENQFNVGDRVTINSTPGVIEEVGLHVTKLRDESGQLFFFPNGAITSVARQPRRATSLVLFVPLAQPADEAKVSDVVRSAIAEFEAMYDAFSAAVEPLPAQGRLLRFGLSARPQRVALLREKLPTRISESLEGAGLEKIKGANVEITFAP